MQIRGVCLKNRVMVSPMWQYCGVNGYPTDWHLMNLGRYADGGAGLIFQEATAVERRGCGTLGDLGLWTDEQILPLKRIVDFVRANGGVPAIQLGHAGRKARSKPPFEGRGPLMPSPDIHDWDEWTPIAPSADQATSDGGASIAQDMTIAQIGEVRDAFVASARRSVEVGYDVLELHAAHGYLLHQFLSPGSNRRMDRYGGSFNNRIRFVEEIVEGVRAVWPEDKPLFIRISCIDNAGWDMADTTALTRRLMPMGVDLVDCTSGGLSGSPLPAGKQARYGYQVEYSSALRRETGVLTAAVGLIVHATQAQAILENGEADIVAIAREFINNPNWVLDAAQKLGQERPFDMTGPRTRFWLESRLRSVPDLVPSTFG